MKGVHESYTKHYKRFHFFTRFYLLILDEKGRRKRERNINVWLPLASPQSGTWPATQVCALTGNRISDPLFYRAALNPLSHTSHGYKIFLREIKENIKWRNI